ncbi:OLC1v1016436C2 [Oldenlandia corymbosa var. corymbosa]|uniref:OLC1v1016436C2 n=1 Tax=Oldenlandia corymbosa var. corymbosa TaxID=529605 RepID=A0AAV1E5N5_OLDCO|nr:OLC1v1016436C2 [Oldenlandia corymbosa var. corymbosa]
MFVKILAHLRVLLVIMQVDLKLKICRGSSVRKIIVREAQSYFASELIVGTSRNHHTIRSSASVAKYCAKKLAKDCSTLAVNNGKVVYHKGASSSHFSIKELEHHHRNGLLSAIQRTLSKNTKAITDGNMKGILTSELGSYGSVNLALGNTDSRHQDVTLKRNCSVCSVGAVLEDDCMQSTDESSCDGSKDTSMAVVPVQKIEVASSSISLLIKELPEVRPGWPLLRRTILSNKRSSNNSSVRQISVVQWALRLPSRQFLSVESNSKGGVCDHGIDHSSEMDGESGAIVPVGGESHDNQESENSISDALPKVLEGLHEKYSATCRLFTYKELLSATSSFAPDNMTGKGGSSKVYRGCLLDGKELAVKILKPSDDALTEFVSEIEIITALNHKNIISLFGFCFEDNQLLLVYDFLSRGSLEDNLHGNKKDPLVFGWNHRYKVAVGVAEALEYLHNRDAQPVIHRDVKSSNILLADDFEPQLSDFGLAKWASTTSSHITCSDVAGTFGYLAPEYFMYGKVNDKIDVYAFGVVLLELLSGRKPISNDYPKGQESIVLWAKPILNCGKFAQLLDPSLAGNYDVDELERMVLAAALCIRRAPRARPQMSLILKLLQGDSEAIKWARLQVNGSEGTNAVHPVVNNSEGPDAIDDETFSQSNLQSHLNLALLGVEDSLSSIEQSISLEEYLRGRWSRSSSFD